MAKKKSIKSVVNIPPVDPSVIVVNEGPLSPWQPFRVQTILTPQQAREEYLARQPELDRQFRKASSVLRKNAKKFEQNGPYGDITGLSVCFRTRYGQIVSPLQYVISVNVSTKFDEGYLPEEVEEIPKEIDGVPIKVREGAFTTLPSEPVIGVQLRTNSLPNNPPALSVPLLGGIPISKEAVLQEFGTLGIHFSLNGGTRAITNEHVAKKGDPIFRVGPGDPPVTQQIGTVTASSHAQIKNRTVDCSLIEVTDGPIQQSTHPRDYDQNKKMFFSKRKIGQIDFNLPVVKFGAKTGVLLRGAINNTLIAKVVTPDLTYQNVFSAKKENQIFVLGGDSGSVLAIDGKVKLNNDWVPAYIVVGLVFGAVANDPSVALCCNISDVFTALGVTIPESELVDRWLA